MTAWHAGVVLCCLLAAGCASPSVEFTTVPESAPGGSGRIETIAGRAKGARKGQRIVLFARSGNWWVQPLSSRPFTPLRSDSTWVSTTHMGTEYAALLVSPAYLPPKVADVLPGRGNGVIAVATVPGRNAAGAATPARRMLRFSGYEWEVEQTPGESAGVMHANSAENAWTDQQGALHLRIARRAGEWTCAEVISLRSLGYGTYSFRVRQATPFDPGTVLGMFTWDDLEAGENHREIDIEVSRWGDPAIKNAQFTIQPYYVPANVFRFHNPENAVTHSFRWEPGRVSFRTMEDLPGQPNHIVAQHVFTSGIPSPGGERVHINLYIYGKSRTPQERGVEVVIEKFEYLP